MKGQNCLPATFRSNPSVTDQHLSFIFPKNDLVHNVGLDLGERLPDFYAAENYISNLSKDVFQKIVNYETISSVIAHPTKSQSLEEKLFDAKANVKVMFSKVSMHFSDETRTKIFKFIDFLHDEDDWEEGDSPINSESFNTFIQWCFLYKPDRLSSFGLSRQGNLIASWLKNDNKDSFILEFMPNEKLRWFLSERFEQEVDNTSGSTDLFRIENLFKKYRSNEWFKIWENT